MTFGTLTGRFDVTAAWIQKGFLFGAITPSNALSEVFSNVTIYFLYQFNVKRAIFRVVKHALSSVPTQFLV